MKEHLRKLTLHIRRYYPNHEDRTETAEYRATRRYLIDEQKYPCWVCGTRLHLECHHFYVEWADANAVDWDSFRKRHPQLAPWDSFDHPAQFVDHRSNMRILCAKHHRHVNHGIHCMDYPSWELQAWDKAAFVFAPE